MSVYTGKGTWLQYFMGNVAGVQQAAENNIIAYSRSAMGKLFGGGCLVFSLVVMFADLLIRKKMSKKTKSFQSTELSLLNHHM